MSQAFPYMSHYMARYYTRRIGMNFSTALQAYISSNNNIIPSNENWIDDIDSKTLRDLSVIDSATGRLLSNFAINSYVAGKDLSELPDDAVIAFETDKTLEHKRVFSAGIKPPQALSINNDKSVGCIVILKKQYKSVHLRQSDTSPQELAELNWMNTDKLILPDGINEYLSKKATSQSIAGIISSFLMIVTIAGLIFFFRAGFGRPATFLMLASSLSGIWWGLPGMSFHYNNSEKLNEVLQAAYASAAASAFIAIIFCFLIFKFHTQLPTGYLRRFISATATVAGILCSIIVHLMFMLINYQWAPLALLCGLGWGIVGGGIMAIIANGLVFRRMLKWEPVVGDASAEQVNEA